MLNSKEFNDKLQSNNLKELENLIQELEKNEQTKEADNLKILLSLLN